MTSTAAHAAAVSEALQSKIKPNAPLVHIGAQLAREILKLCEEVKEGK